MTLLPLIIKAYATADRDLCVRKLNIIDNGIKLLSEKSLPETVSNFVKHKEEILESFCSDNIIDDTVWDLLIADVFALYDENLEIRTEANDHDEEEDDYPEDDDDVVSLEVESVTDDGHEEAAHTPRIYTIRLPGLEAVFAVFVMGYALIEVAKQVVAAAS
jgi:hypothetical protein